MGKVVLFMKLQRVHGANTAVHCLTMEGPRAVINICNAVTVVSLELWIVE